MTGRVSVRPFGATTPARWRPATPVDVVEVSSSLVSLQLLTLGAAIMSIETPDLHGRPGPVHLRLASLRDYEDAARNPHLGASIGRVANRIAGSRFPLDGTEVQVMPNEGPNQLHGGPIGFDRHVWELLSAEPTEDGGTAVFGLVSPHGDQGFPGTLTATAIYELHGNLLRMIYRATTDAPTVVNLTNHGYWNLDGCPTIHDHVLTLAAARVLPVDSDGIPTDEFEPVDRTCFDLRRPTLLGPAMAASPTGGFDHCFAIDGADDALRPAAVLHAPGSGRWMSVQTDRPGIQLYTGNGLGTPFQVHGSVSLETQRFPDTPNRPDLGSAVLRPGGVDVTVTELRFGAGTPPRLEHLGHQRVSGASSEPGDDTAGVGDESGGIRREREST